ncbi:hypothetical protein BAB79_15095 [Mycobacteroides abscessus]|nr:hypothetical protein A3O06_15100 [Mycobacteroides abscessus]ANO24740.1 hypothetical protein BAB79_15095 [Mycobacteroides abscessus]
MVIIETTSKGIDHERQSVGRQGKGPPRKYQRAQETQRWPFDVVHSACVPDGADIETGVVCDNDVLPMNSMMRGNASFHRGAFATMSAVMP